MRGRWAVSSRCRDALAGVARPACALTTWLSGGATEFGGTSAKAISGAKARCAAGADQDRHPQLLHCHRGQADAREARPAICCAPVNPSTFATRRHSNRIGCNVVLYKGAGVCHPGVALGRNSIALRNHVPPALCEAGIDIADDDLQDECGRLRRESFRVFGNPGYRNMRTILTGMALSLFLVGLAGCESRHPATRVGAALDRAGTKTGQAVGHAATVTGRALDRTGNYIQRQVTPSSSY